ncbi:MAG: energy transducer TonB [Leptospiraceae bacterium]|nr:energy transducer TonB [Leptospiraceae bacterium]MDW8306706.1 TonB family protein [Leptospiraceae bacterium]
MVGQLRRLRSIHPFFLVSCLIHAAVGFAYWSKPKQDDLLFLSVKLTQATNATYPSQRERRALAVHHRENLGSSPQKLTGEILASKLTYEMLLASQLEKHRYYPVMALRLRQEGTCVVRMYLDLNGHVVKKELAKSCGQPILDEAALDIVAKAEPFPPLPEPYREYLEKSGEKSCVFFAPIGFQLSQR